MCFDVVVCFLKIFDLKCVARRVNTIITSIFSSVFFSFSLCCLLLLLQNFYFLRDDLSFFVYVMFFSVSLFETLSLKFFLCVFDFVRKSGYSVSFVVVIFLIIIVIGARLKDSSKMCVCTRYKRNRKTTQLFPLFAICCLFLTAALICLFTSYSTYYERDGFILSTTHSIEIIFSSFLPFVFLRFLLSSLVGLLCYTSFRKVDDTLYVSCLSQSQTLAVYQISIRRHSILCNVCLFTNQQDLRAKSRKCISFYAIKFQIT